MSLSSCPKIFILILNYNGQAVLKNCLTSVFKIKYPNYEVVLVDNNSADGSFEFAKSNFSRAHFIKNQENFGYAAGNNVGIRFALERLADYILLLNNDTEVEEDFLDRLLEVAEKEKAAGIFSPIIFNGRGKAVWFSGGKISWLKMKAQHSQEIRTQNFYTTEFISGCAMLIRANVFKCIGLLDEDYFLYWEDVDFSFRAQRAGFRNLIVTRSWVYHFEKSQEKIKQKSYWLVLSGLIFFQKNTTFWLRLWIKLYSWLRRVKNWKDRLNSQNEIAQTVGKAYQDFKYVGL